MGRAGTACYGCASACVEHCLTLLKALASKRSARAHLHQQGLVPELLNHNLRRGTAATRSSVQVHTLFRILSFSSRLRIQEMEKKTL
jgi:hypothetical protein